MDKKQNFFLVLLQGINIIRIIIVNIVFFVLLFVAFSFLLALPSAKKNPVQIGYGTILEISPSGIIGEKEDEYSWLDVIFSEGRRTSRISEIISAIREAAFDERVEGLYFDFSYLSGLSSSHLTELKEAIKVFKDSEKPIWAYSSFYGIKDYYIASFANKIGLDPLGEVSLQGFASESLYYKGMEEKFGIKFQTFQAGEYKGAAEPFSRTEMSEQVRENLSSMLFDMWNVYLKDVSNNIGKSEESIKSFAEKPYELLLKYAGDEARMAQAEGFITDILTESEFREKMEKECSNLSGEALNFVSYVNYIKNINKKKVQNKIAVIYLNGAITSSGKSNRNADVAISYEVENMFEKAMHDDYVKAIVLRVDSGGGEVFASELIRRSLIKAKEEYEKPVVVSMASVAASGAYWISSAADYVFATPFTITGSIGVLAMTTNFQELLRDKLGITSDSVGVLKNTYSSIKPLTEEQIMKISLSIDSTYNLFLETVSKGRSIDKAKVKDMAGGRVYSGERAKALGLVDEIGTFQDAINKAASLSEIEDFNVIEIKKEPTPMRQFINTLMRQENSYFDIGTIKGVFELLNLKDKKGIYAYTPLRLMWAK